MAFANLFEGLSFRVKWDGRYIPGISKISALVRVTEVVDLRDGADPNVSRAFPGRTKYDPITLERGLTVDTSFEDWANDFQAIDGGQPTGSAPGGFRKQISIDLFNESEQLIRSYKVFQCWPIRYEPLPTLGGGRNDVAVEHITLEHEGWERDTSVVPPAQ